MKYTSFYLYILREIIWNNESIKVPVKFCTYEVSKS